MLLSEEIWKYQTGCFSSQPLNLVFPDLCSLRSILYDSLFLFFRKTGIIVKRKEPMYPSGFWFFFQLVFDFLRCAVFPFRKRSAAIDIFLVHVKAWIIRVKGCYKIITAHRCFTNKINIRCIDLIDVQTSILTAKCILPLALVSISDHKNDFIPAGCMEQNVWHLVFSGSISFVLSQYSEIIQNAEIFVDDVFFCGSRVICCQDMQFLCRFSNLQHKFKQTNSRLSRRCRAFQELNRGIAS